MTASSPFAAVQTALAGALSLNTAGIGRPHTIVALPSFNVSETLLSHYADRLPSLEHRYLLALLALRIEGCRLVFLTCRQPPAEVVDLYISLLPPDRRSTALDRFEVIVVDDLSPRPVAAKVLERPEVLAEIRRAVGDTPAFIEPWSVGGYERDLSVALGIPINGTAPDLWPLGFKSAGRHLFRRAGVPMPDGFEDLHTVGDAVEAIERLRAASPGLGAVVLKHDDSGAGDGNAVLELTGLEPAGTTMAARRLRARIKGLPPWYLNELPKGFVVEERVVGTGFASPSAQVDISPDGSVRVLSTHEQVLGGPDDQVYLGCRLPADGAYAADLAAAALSVGEVLASEGAVGRAAVDFVVTVDAGRWRHHALEINLRKGGTTHPYTALRNLVVGSYDADAGQYLAADGSPRCYVSTDNLVSEEWTTLAVADVLRSLDEAGLIFDRGRGVGVVPYMLSGLAIDGRFGLTAIGRTSDEAQELFDGCRTAVDVLALRTAAASETR